ncbi:MAG: Gfo/Idh/MocA family oxidoreductase [Ornithinimicrobium sp.]|uniref:Gfo/Idh/MocA family protein n=1 Tax=Ornithinimicrobium sp. TaxID=1977084 RepID=UPI0026E043C8|nr:Gfo/Idh/MocA family oxidoreductase [Ornithinimicrobium sp.]MDO5738791.1 Gfo/Idh/MocA family oxidoreductase [Ornithinimicrobium sp.]
MTAPGVTNGTIGVGMIGYAFMGAAHSQAWRSAPRFFDLPVRPQMRVICGRDGGKAEAARAQLGWDEVESDYRVVLARDDIGLVDICTPGNTHAEIAIAALAAGKHVLCEKPMANTVEEAEAMAQAAAEAAVHGIIAMVGFTYRRVPAIALARDLVAQGRLGTLRHVRAQYLQDWIVDPQAPLSWRLQKESAGSGALGDIGAHIIDLTEFITGERLESVSGLLETFINQRPIPTQASGLSGTGGDTMGAVTVDDAALFLGRFSGGAVATYEATRFATGRKNAIRIEVNGSDGSLAFDFESMNELHFFDNTTDVQTQGFTRILVTEPTHPYVSAWWPPGHLLGYEHAFSHQVVDLMASLGGQAGPPTPNFADGLHVQRVLAAVEASAASGTWTQVEPDGIPGRK